MSTNNRRRRLGCEPLEPRLQLAADLPALEVAGGVIELPGTADQQVTIRAEWTERQAEYDNEFGVFVVDNGSRVAGTAPGDVDYSRAALSTSQVVFASGEGAGTTTELVFAGGTRLGSFIVQDDTTKHLLDANPHNTLDLRPHVFFATSAANPDGFEHVRVDDLGDGVWQLRWEDITGGQDDFTDVVLTLQVVAIEQIPAPTARTFRLDDAPEGVSIDADTGDVDWNNLPPGTYDLRVTIAGEATPPPDEPNLPPGHPDIPGLTPRSQVFIEDFESGGLSDVWTECGRCEGHTEIVAAPDGDHAFQISYDRDEESAILSVYPIEFDSIYMSYAQQFPNGFKGRTLKQSRIFQSPGGVQGVVGVDIWNDRLDGTQQIVTTFEASGDGFYTPYEFPAGRWVRTAWQAKLNDPGEANGSFRLWRDDELVADVTGLVLRTTEERPDGFWIGGNYSGAGVDPAPFDRLIDDILVVTDPADDFDHAAATDAFYERYEQ